MPSERLVKQQLKAVKFKFKVIKIKPTDSVGKTVRRCIRDFKTMSNGIDIRENTEATRAVRRLQARCFWAHEQLAVEPVVEIDLDSLHAGKDYRRRVARDDAFPLDSDWSKPHKTNDDPRMFPQLLGPAHLWQRVHDNAGPAAPPMDHDDADDTFSDVSSPEEVS